MEPATSTVAPEAKAPTTSSPNGVQHSQDAAAPEEMELTAVTSPAPPPAYDEHTTPAPAVTSTSTPQQPQTEGTRASPGQSAAQQSRPENYVVRLEDLKETPDFIDCPYCHSRQKTNVVKNDTSQTTLAALFCCLFCGVITVCIPIMCHWFADIDHHCSGCHKRVAHMPHDGKMEAVLPRPEGTPMYAPSQFAPMSAQPQQTSSKVEGPVNV
ncbi:hypothetical protein B0H66DRAFT_552556 [Apodospora peruviana]|uniref:LITAF domain-containing protein n=1 Tax=Apodospora peruviana TaxID=516989 RepID=A0AAE0IAW9_9PEZI|nr:hypothetical protein B0H66DRAFT_552556 [Apodospora peruviana]